jgi:hypothetical protein
MLRVLVLVKDLALVRVFSFGGAGTDFAVLPNRQNASDVPPVVFLNFILGRSSVGIR